MGIEDLWRTLRRSLARYEPASRVPPSTPLAQARFVVVDTETSGLDTGRDRLLSIGACVVQGGRSALGESFYRELRQASASGAANILIHGIGGEAQLAGESEEAVLRAFLAFAGPDPLVAFNAPFDHAFLARAVRRCLGSRYSPYWFDLAQLPRALYPAEAEKRRTLDDWLDRFEIVALERHNALDDAYCTAQLLLALLAKARSEGIADLAGLRAAERHHTWMQR